MKRRKFYERVMGKAHRNRLNRRIRRLKGELLEDRVALAAHMLLTGAGASGGPHVRAMETVNQQFDFFAYAPNFTGGVRVAAGDVNGDGRDDMITGAGTGGGPHVKVFDGANGRLLHQFFAFEGGFTGGIHVAAGDINADGKAEIFVGADGATSGGRVRVFNGQTGALLQDLVAPSSAFAGGVRVAAGDVNADGRADLVMGAGPGSQPRVAVRDLNSGQVLSDFLAYDSRFTGGVYVAAGNVSGDGRAEIITGADAGGGPHVRIFDAGTLQEIRAFFAYGTGFSGGVRVAAADYNGDGVVDIITGAGAGGGPHVRVFSGNNLAELRSFFAYSTAFSGGVFVGGPVVALAGAGPIGPPPTDLGYHIAVTLRTPMTPSQAAAFQGAANTLMQIVTGDLPDIPLFADDLLIDAFVTPIDGPGRILGSAGPNFLRNIRGTGGLPGVIYNGLPVGGQMLFDSADLAQLEADGQLFDVILHEMGHVLGLGSLWGFQGLIQGSFTPDPRFRGSLATLEYNRIFGRNDTSVPIESFFTAGPGSGEGHWRESVFVNELMTPFAEAAGTAMPFSRISAAALADMGYEVNMASPFIDAYAPPGGATGFLVARGLDLIRSTQCASRIT